MINVKFPIYLSLHFLVCRSSTHCSDVHGHPAHRVAFNCGQWHCFHWLYSRSLAHLDDADRRGHTLLHDAAEQGRADVVLLLLALGSSVDARDNHGRTALMTAAFNGHAEIGAQLIACGADINAEDDDGRDAQTIALAQSRWSMVRLLEDEGEVRARSEAEKEGMVGQAALGLDEVDGQVCPLLFSRDIGRFLLISLVRRW